MGTVEIIKDPIVKLIKEMHANIKEMETDQKNNNEKIDGLMAKVTQLKTKSNESDLRNSKAIEDLKDEMSKVKTRVTSNLLAEIEPSLIKIKGQIQESVGLDLRKLVREELTLQKTSPVEPATSEDEDDVNKGE